MSLRPHRRTSAQHDVERENEGDQRRAPHEPLHLQALDADRAAEAEDDRKRAGEDARKHPDGERDPDPGVDDELSDGVAEQRIGEVLVRRRYGSGSNSFSPTVNPKLTIAIPATQRQRRDRSRPSGKTNATASGQANRIGGTVAASVWYAHAAPTSCSAAIWRAGRSAPSRRIQAMRLRGSWRAIRRPTTAGDRIASARNG